MSRNAISANPKHDLFKIFLSSMPRTPPTRPDKIILVFLGLPPPLNKESYTSFTPKIKLS